MPTCYVTGCSPLALPLGELPNSHSGTMECSPVALPLGELPNSHIIKFGYNGIQPLGSPSGRAVTVGD